MCDTGIQLPIAPRWQLQRPMALRWRLRFPMAPHQHSIAFTDPLGRFDRAHLEASNNALLFSLLASFPLRFLLKNVPMMPGNAQHRTQLLETG